MTLPKSYKAYRRSTDKPLRWVPVTESLPDVLGPGEVLIKIHAVSLNFRDYAIMSGRYPLPLAEAGIPASDAAAEVVAIGSAVSDFEIGDHVSPSFYVNRLTEADIEQPKGLGGDVDGVLSQYRIFDRKVLVHLPRHLPWEEAATLPCVGVTSWNAIDQMKELDSSSVVLLEGTGGLSVFTLLLLTGAGIKVIITSSSDEKIANLKKLSPLIEGINYKTSLDITQEILQLTDGKGVNLFVSAAGEASLNEKIEAVAESGTISLVGFLSGLENQGIPRYTLMRFMFKHLTLRGITVGSAADFKMLNSFIAEKSLRFDKLIGKVFSFDEALEAFDYLCSQQGVGKIVIKL